MNIYIHWVIFGCWQGGQSDSGIGLSSDDLKTLKRLESLARPRSFMSRAWVQYIHSCLSLLLGHVQDHRNGKGCRHMPWRPSYRAGMWMTQLSYSFSPTSPHDSSHCAFLGETCLRESLWDNSTVERYCLRWQSQQPDYKSRAGHVTC